MENYRRLNKLGASSLLAALISLGLSGCDSANSEESVARIKTVKLLEVPQQQDQQTDSFIAKLDAHERAALSFQVAGQLAALPVKMGESVKQGDLLAYLDPTDYQIALDAKRAEFELAETQFQRAERLYKKRLISTDQYDQIETNFQVARVALAQAKEDLSYTEIHAPFDGTVSLSFAKPHQIVGAKQPVMNLIDIRQMDVSFSLPVTYASEYQMTTLQDATFHVILDSHRDVLLPATFKEITTQPNKDTNSYTATVSIIKPIEMNALVDMSATVEVTHASESQHFHLAESALLSQKTEQGKSKGVVWRYNPDSQTVSQVEVLLDKQGDVISGLSQGDLIVEAGVEQLTAGEVVKVWTKESGI